MQLIAATLLVFLGSTHNDRVTTINVDCVEHNTIYHENGNVFKQLILRRWSRSHGSWNHWVTDWRTDNGNVTIITGGSETVIWLKDEFRSYRIVTKRFRETKTTDDPEMLERKKHPEFARVPYLVIPKIETTMEELMIGPESVAD